MDSASLEDLLVIADAAALAPTAFLVRRTLQRIEQREIGAAEAAAALRAWEPTLGLAPHAVLRADQASRALSIARLFDR